MICTKNTILIVIAAMALIAAVWITKIATETETEKKMRRVCQAQSQGTARKWKSKLASQESKAKGEIARILKEQTPPELPPYYGMPVNELTSGYVDNWKYIGYVFPKNPDVDKRYPLYSRRNLSNRHQYDYYVVDNSRNRVRINIDLPNGTWQLFDNDEIEIDSESGKWVVRIDIPGDWSFTPYLGANLGPGGLRGPYWPG